MDPIDELLNRYRLSQVEGGDPIDELMRRYASPAIPEEAIGAPVNRNTGSVISRTAQGVMRGIDQGVFALVRGLDSVLPGDPIQGLLGGKEHVAKVYEKNEQAIEELGTAGKAGSFGGRVAFEAATALLGGGATKLLAARNIPGISGAARAIERVASKVAGPGTSAFRRGAAEGVRYAPFGALTGAGDALATGDSPLAGASFNVAADVIGGGVLEGVVSTIVRKLSRGEPLNEIEEAAMRELTNQAESVPVAVVSLPRNRLLPRGPLVTEPPRQVPDPFQEARREAMIARAMRGGDKPEIPRGSLITEGSIPTLRTAATTEAEDVLQRAAASAPAPEPSLGITGSSAHREMVEQAIDSEAREMLETAIRANPEKFFGMGPKGIEEFFDQLKGHVRARYRGERGGVVLHTPPELGGAILGGVIGANVAPEGHEDEGLMLGVLAGAAGPFFARRIARSRHPISREGIGEAQKVLRSVATEPKKAVSIPLSQKVDRVYQDVVDATYSLTKFGRRFGGDDELEHLVVQASGWEGAAESMIKSERGLRGVIQKAKGYEPQVMALAIAERAVELADEFGYVKKGVDLDQARQAIARLSAIPEVRAATDALQAYYRRLLDMKYEAGLVSDEAYMAMRLGHQKYVPFVRDFMEEVKEAAPGARGLVQRGTTIRKMTDAEALDLIRNPFEQAVYDTYIATRAIGRQRVTNMVVQLHDAALLAGRQDIGEFIREVPAGKSGPRIVDVNIRGSRRRFQIVDKDLYDSWASMAPSTMDVVESLSNRAKKLLQTGVTHHPVFGIFNAIRDFANTVIQYPVPFKQQVGGAAVGALAGAATAPDDESRLERALIGAGLGSAASAVAPHAIRVISALADMAGIGDRRVYEEWLEAGGTGFGFFAKSQSEARALVESLRRQEGFDPRSIIDIRSWWEGLKIVNRAIEEAPRFARYKYLRSQGASKAASVAGGRDSSLDFSRQGGGAVVKVLNRNIAFYNAKIQGLDKLVRMFVGERGADGRFRFGEKQARHWFMGLTTITAPTIALWQINKDDPEYWARSATERNLFWLVPFGTREDGRTRFLPVPKPFEVGAIFASIPERFLDFAYQRGYLGDVEFSAAPGSKEGFKQIAAGFTEGLLPVPTIARAPLETMIGPGGFDFFTGRDIVDPRLQRLTTEEQFDDQTSTLGVLAGKVGVSPQKFDHLVQGMTGSLGTFANQRVTDALRAAGVDPRGEAQPAFEGPSLTSRLTTRPESLPSQVVQLNNRYFELQKVINTLNHLERTDPARLGNFINDHIDEIVEYRQIQPFAERIQEVRSLMETISQDQTVPPEQRRRQLLELRALIADLANVATQSQRM